MANTLFASKGATAAHNEASDEVPPEEDTSRGGRDELAPWPTRAVATAAML